MRRTRRSGKGSNRKNSGKKSSRRSSKSRRFQKDALMNRMKQSQQQAEGGIGVIKSDAQVTLWRPKDGSHIVDIIPYEVGKFNVDGEKPGTPHYTFRYFSHRQVGPANQLVICPLKTWGKDCPICEEKQRLYDTGKYTAKEDWEKVIRPLNSSERYIYNIVCYDRGEEEKGVQIWDVSNHYFQKHIMALSKKPRRGGQREKNVLFFDEEEGQSITFTIEAPKSKEDFAEYVGHSFDDRDYSIPDEILDSVHCLDEIVQIYSYDEIAKMFKGRSGGGEDPDAGGDDDDNIDDLLDELDDIEDNDDLEDFCEENDLDVKLKGGKRFFDKNVERVRDALEELKDGNGDDSAGGGGDSNDDSDVTVDDIDEMSLKQLKRLIKKEDLEVDLDDYDKDEIDDLRDAVIEELGLDDD